jgi:DNA replication protein DnaD
MSQKFYELYGKIIASRGVAPIPTVLFRYQKELDLTPQETFFVCNILTFRWTSREDGTTPSIKEMARTSGVSERTLRTYKKSLDEKGYLMVIPRFDNTGQLTNAYDLTPLFEKLEQLIIAENSEEKFDGGMLFDRTSRKDDKKVSSESLCENIPSAKSAAPPAEFSPPPAEFAALVNTGNDTITPLQNLQSPLQNLQGRLKQAATEVDIACIQAFKHSSKQNNKEIHDAEHGEKASPHERARAMLKSAGLAATDIEVDFLVPWLHYFQDDMVKYALQKTVFAGKNLYYAEGIFESWRSKKVYDLESAIKESRYDIVKQPPKEGIHRNRLISIRRKM